MLVKLVNDAGLLTKGLGLGQVSGQVPERSSCQSLLKELIHPDKN